MKNLSKVTLEDAKQIIAGGYPDMMDNLNADWALDSVNGVPRLMNQYKIYSFFFFDDHIAIGCREMIFEHFSVKLGCIIKALEIGYRIKHLDYRREQKPKTVDARQQELF